MFGKAKGCGKSVRLWDHSKCRCHSNLIWSDISNLFSFSKQFLLTSHMINSAVCSATNDWIRIAQFE